MLMTILTVEMLLSSTEALSGSCRASGRCCDGKNTDCNSDSADLNSLIMMGIGQDEPCYCDQGCLEMGDCCPDYKEFCEVEDCQVSAWSSWTECSSKCGPGTSTRSRTVIKEERNGGVSCPDLHQTKKCKGEGFCTRRNEEPKGLTRLHHKSSSSVLRETAIILPGKYSQLTEQDAAERYDVRENLKTFKREEISDEYCVVFKVDKAMKSCRHHEETEDLVRGAEICVSCESKATRPHLGDRCSGHGVENKATRFKNIITPGCHGRWTKTAVFDKCPCRGGPHFIFV